MKTCCLLLLFAATTAAYAGIGDDLNTALKNKANPQFTPLGNQVMLITCRDQGFLVSFWFMGGIEEGLSFSRIDKRALDTKTLNRLTQTYAPAGQWHKEFTKGGVTYYRCQSLGLWSHYDSVVLKGWPAYFIYTDKLSIALGDATEHKHTTTSYSPDRDL